MLIVEEGGKSILMTGDGHADDILAGLDVNSKTDAEGAIHVDVLKVQHHGSEHNWHADFGRRVTADHYVFCGNGRHDNPDERVVDGIIQSRLGSGGGRSRNPRSDGRFKLWINSSSAITEGDVAHFKKLEKLVDREVRASGGRMQSAFLKSGSSFAINV